MFNVVAGRVVKAEVFAGGVEAAMDSVVGVVIAGVPVEALVTAAAPALIAALMAESLLAFESLLLCRGREGITFEIFGLVD